MTHFNPETSITIDKKVDAWLQYSQIAWRWQTPLLSVFIVYISALFYLMSRYNLDLSKIISFLGLLYFTICTIYSVHLSKLMNSLRDGVKDYLNLPREDIYGLSAIAVSAPSCLFAGVCFFVIVWTPEVASILNG